MINNFSGPTLKERLWGAASHISAAIWLWIPFGHVIGPLIVRFIAPKTEFVTSSCSAAIRFQAWMALVLIITFLFTNIMFGNIAILVISIFSVSIFGIASLCSLNGRYFSYDYFVPPWFTVKRILVTFGAIVTCIAVAIIGLKEICTGKLQEDWPARPNKEFASENGLNLKNELLHNTLFPYSQLSSYVYHDDEDSSIGKYPGGFWWQSFGSFQNTSSGFYAEAFESPAGEVVIAYRGTENWPDIVTDLSMAIGVIPQQFKDAESMLEIVNNILVNRPKVMMLTGHSLGGALAQYVAARNHVRAITFNPFGVARLVGEEELKKSRVSIYPPSVLNIVQSTDIVSNADISYTLSGILKTFISNMKGNDEQHVGCMGAMFNIIKPKEALSLVQLFGWHSVSKLNNSMIFMEFGAPEGFLVDQCVPPIPSWHLPARWVCEESGENGLMTNWIRSIGGCPGPGSGPSGPGSDQVNQL